MLKCLSCAYCHIHGYGYSDWTWEGDEVVCVKGLLEPKEKSKKSDHSVDNCPQYTTGIPYEESPDGVVLGGEKLRECSKC